MRKFTTAVLAVLTTATMALLPTGSAQAAAGDNPGALRPLTSSSELAKLQLQKHTVLKSSLDNLDSLMGTERTVQQVLDSANHPMRNAADRISDETGALPIDPKAESAYCWGSGDSLTQDRLPQSVTTSGAPCRCPPSTAHWTTDAT
jgi:hypothetical protein